MALNDILISIFIIFMLGEFILAQIKKSNIYSRHETFSNFMVGFISFGIEYIFSLFTLPFIIYLYNHRWFTIHWDYIYVFVILFIAIDFTEYWFHRLSHQVNLLWAAHVVHHQNEFFNLSTGLRTSFFVPIFNILFYLIFPLLGFSPEIIFTIIFLQGFYQLLIHTILVNKLGFLEYIFVTPSVHRVHHGKNEIYIDKNFGKVLLIWDLLFGTYEQETEVVQFGVKEESNSLNAWQTIVNPFRKLVKVIFSLSSKGFRWKILFGKPDDASDILQDLRIVKKFE